jgi:hypothetical protein
MLREQKLKGMALVAALLVLTTLDNLHFVQKIFFTLLQNKLLYLIERSTGKVVPSTMYN